MLIPGDWRESPAYCGETFMKGVGMTVKQGFVACLELSGGRTVQINGLLESSVGPNQWGVGVTRQRV